MRRPGSYQATGTGWYRAEGTSARASRALTGRDRVGRPKSTTRSIGCADSGPNASRTIRYGPTAFGPNRALEDGSASSGRPWARANASATGPASCPASTTVRRSGSAGRGGREIEGQRAAGRAVHAAAGLGRQPVAGRGNQRVAEGQVELHRPGRGVLEGPGGGAERGLDGAPRVAAGGHVGGETDMLTEQVQLHRGLVGAGPAEFLGAVGRDHHERDGGVVGLHHGRQEIPDGGPGGGEHGRGRTRGEGQAQGGEAGVALVDPDQQLDPSGGVGLGQGVGHRRGARARRHHHVAHPLEQQGRDGDPRGIQRAQLLRAQARSRAAHMFSGVSMPSRSRPSDSRRRTRAHRASRDSRTESSDFSTGHWS